MQQQLSNSTDVHSNKIGISELLASIDLLEPRWLNQIVKYVPVAFVVFLVADLLVGKRLFWNDWFRLSGLIMALVELVLARLIFNHSQQMLRSIWQRNLIQSKTPDASIADSYHDALTSLRRRINGIGNWILGVCFALGGLVSTYPARYWLTSCVGDRSAEYWARYCATFMTWAQLLNYYTIGNLGLSAVVLGFLFGILLWKVWVITRFATELFERFKLNFQFAHADQCAGFRYVGQMFLLNAVAFIFPMLFLAAMIFGSPLLARLGLRMDVFEALWGGFFRWMLLGLIVMAVVWLFWGPILRLHRSMVQRKVEIEAEIDSLEAKAQEPHDASTSNIAERRTDELVRLRDSLEERFNLEEMSKLCFDLGIDHENVPGVTKSAKAMSIVQLFDRLDRLADLVAYFKRMRPNANWDKPSKNPRQALLLAGLGSIENPRSVLDRIPTWPLPKDVLMWAMLIQIAVLIGLLSLGIIPRAW